jgi:hypothetical protein
VGEGHSDRTEAAVDVQNFTRNACSKVRAEKGCGITDIFERYIAP